MFYSVSDLRYSIRYSTADIAFSREQPFFSECKRLRKIDLKKRNKNSNDECFLSSHYPKLTFLSLQFHLKGQKENKESLDWCMMTHGKSKERKAIEILQWESGALFTSAAQSEPVGTQQLTLPVNDAHSHLSGWSWVKHQKSGMLYSIRHLMTFVCFLHLVIFERFIIDHRLNKTDLKQTKNVLWVSTIQWEPPTPLRSIVWWSLYHKVMCRYGFYS